MWCSGDDKRKVRTVVHDGVKGLAEFESEYGFGYDDYIEKAAATKKVFERKLKAAEAPTGRIDVL